MLLRSIAVTLLFELTVVTSLYSQTNYQYSFQNLTFREGLSHSYVTDIEQDTLGYIWLATRNGLNRFDGTEVVVFKHTWGDTTSLADNHIRKIFLDSQQRMWLVTSSGVCRYRPATNDFKTYPFDVAEKHDGNLPLDIAEGPDGQILVLSHFNTLSVLSEENQRFRKVLDIKSETVVQSLGTYQDRIFVGAQRLLLEVDPSHGTIIDAIELHDESQPLSAGISQITTVGHELWIAGSMINLHRFDPVTGHLEKITSLPYVTSLAPFTDQVFFVGSHRGVFLYDTVNDRVSPLQSVDDATLLSNITGVFVDRDRNLWAASQEKGALYTTGERVFRDFRDLSTTLASYKNDVTSLQVVDGELWVGLKVGRVAAIDVNEQRHRWVGESETGLWPGKRSVFSITQDRQQRIWVGSYEGGLRRYDPSADRFVQSSLAADSSQIRTDDVRSIVQDPRGQLWLAVHGRGIDVYDPAHQVVVASYGLSAGDAEPYISDWPFQLVVAPDSAVWIATPSGLQVIKGAHKRYFQHRADHPEGLSSDNVTCLLSDRRGHLWVGTSEGLNLLNPQDSTFTKFTIQEGLNDNHISSIVEDASGELWIGTYDGLARLSYASSPQDARIRKVALPDGLYSNQFVERAGVADTTGNVYFATTEGILAFNPDDLSTGKSKLEVFLTDFKVLNPSLPEGQTQSADTYLKGRAVNTSDQSAATYLKNRMINTLDRVSLAANENTISISFAAIDFVHSGQIEYRYQLRGYDKQWLVSTQRSVTYHDLPAGEYEFVVKASPKNVTDVSSGKSLFILIRKPWYATLWGRGILALVVLALVMLGIYVMLEQIRLKNQARLSEKEREVDQFKIKFFMNVSHEFRTPLTLIMGPLKRLIGGVDAREAHRHLRLIQRNTQRLYQLVNQLLDMRQLEQERYRLHISEGELVSFVRSIYDSFQYLAQHHHLTYEFHDRTTSTEGHWFDADVLDKILYNLLSNAFKYTPDQGKIEVIVADHPCQAQGVAITVSDTGVGIETEQLTKIFNRFYRIEQTAHQGGAGIGLALCQELTYLHQGELTVNSTPGQGSAFTVAIPTQAEVYPTEVVAAVRPRSGATQDQRVTAISPASWESEDSSGIVTALSADSERKPLVLVVDDNPDLLLFVRESIALDFTVITAQHGQEAFQRAVSTIPDAVVSDVMMPVMNGLQLAKQLKEDMRTSHIPVVLLTARASERYQVEGLREGVDDYLTKPFSVEVLVAKLHSLMDNRARLKELFSGDRLGVRSRVQESGEQAFLLKLTNIIDKNLENDALGTPDICQALGMSRSQLYRKLSAVTGNSVHEFVKLYRLAQAAALLTTGQYTVAEVASRTGFKHPQSFARSFKGHYGCTPTQYADRRTQQV